MRRFSFVLFSLLLLAAIPLAISQSLEGGPKQGARNVPGMTPAASHTEVLGAYGRLPLSFEANDGQSSPEVKFLVRGLGYALFLTQDQAVLSLQDTRPDGEEGRAPLTALPILPGASELPRNTGAQLGMPASVLRMQMVGANPAAKVVGAEELPGKSNYFIGNQPEKWRANLATYAKVNYHQVYPGVDLIYYGNQGRLEYDFVVAPGASPRRIRLAISHAEGNSKEKAANEQPLLRIDTSGDLVVANEAGEVRYQKPVAYQLTQPRTDARNEQRELVDARFVLRSESEVGFEVGPYDATRPLIIDPTLVYSTYLTGNYFENGNAIAVDSSGYAYVTGVTFSGVPSFPITPGAYQQTCGTDAHCNSGKQTYYYIGNTDAFVTKLSLDGSTLVWSTYLGGSYDEIGRGIAVDSSGNVIVAGYTRSADFPTTPGAFETTCGLYVLSAGNGSGNPPNCPIYVLSSCGGGAGYGEFQPSGIINGFVTKLNSTGSGLVYSTFVGGTGNTDINGLAIDAAGKAYIVGRTDSSQSTGYQFSAACPVGYSTAHPTTPTGFMAAPPLSGTAWPGFLPNGYFTVLSADGKSLVYSTYLGSTGPYLNQATLAVAVDSLGDAYVTGYTNSPTFPTTNGAFQTAINKGAPSPNCGGADCLDAFVSKFDLSKSGAASLVYSTFLGSSGNDLGTAIAVDSAGNAYVAGQTNYNGNQSPDFPTTPGAFQSSCPSPAPCQNLKGFVTKLNAAGSGEVYSSYLGGTSSDGIGAIALDSTGRAYVTGSTNSADFPNKNAASLTAGGGSNAFVSVFTADGSNLDFSGRLGGSAYTFGQAIALDPSENIYLTGYTLDQNFPTTPTAFQTSCAHCGTSGTNQAAFVAKISAVSGATTAETITLGSLSQTYDATPKAATATTSPNAGLGVLITYAGTGGTVYPMSSTPPTNAGSYAVDASLTSPGYTAPDATGTLVILPAPATLTLTLGSLSQNYDGTPKAVTVTTSPGGLAVVSVTYNGLATLPVHAGSYSVSASLSNANYSASTATGTLVIAQAPLTVTANNAAKIIDAANPAFIASYSAFAAGDSPASLAGTLSCTTTATTTSPVGSYPINCSGQTAIDYKITYVPGTLKISYAGGGIVDGAPSHQILSPINADGTGVYRQGRTLPAQFRVGDANGVSIGTPGVVSSFFLTGIITGTVTTVVDNVVDTNNPDTAFRWDATNQQWLFNITTKNLASGSTYVYTITLNDGSTISFQIGLR